MLQCSRERRATRDSTRDGGINSVMEGGGSSATFTGKTQKCEAEAADLSEGVRSSKMIAGPPRKSFKRLPQWGRRLYYSSSGTSDRNLIEVSQQIWRRAYPSMIYQPRYARFAMHFPIVPATFQ